ncbi:hypothetical protein EJ04DRAFT_508537 [Polyplosphaeria fusca]|uniref:Uncharacterized protein n=1 Tax=Polyplosphaeria fusca TaxID=682080 RepID=A0A9P4V4L2_9PLEO|nr:hypothetical protein EJ04DRAFT_508537 [Polyplosphaeria fusca]
MAGDTMEAMPMAPQSPGSMAGAVLQWLLSRRGRVILLTATFMIVFAGFTSFRHSESISSSYHAISENYHLPSWRPHLPHLPSIISSPLRPSDTTHELEDGGMKHVPSQLTKKTPNFHLLMPALIDNDDFCKTSLSAKMLNYPAPTVINLFQTFSSQYERELTKIKSISEYLNNERLVSDEDLVLIVDGHDTWFQLPSEVMIRQYEGVVADANKRLSVQYGSDAKKEQAYTQTIIFGAEKRCEGEDLACRYMSESTLPEDIYGERTGTTTELTRAKYLDAGSIMGPAKDMRALFEAAVKKFNAENSQAGTTQSVLATLYGEQELARHNAQKPLKPEGFKWLDWFIDGTVGRSKKESTQEIENVTLSSDQRYEFSIGLDFTHTLFQPFIYVAEDELAALPHDDSVDLAAYHRDGTPTPPLTIPTALQQAKPPFWTPDLSKTNPSPSNNKPSVIEPLAINEKLDELKPRDTSWSELSLIQNTYTGSVPVALHLNLLPPPLTATSKAKRRLPDVRGHAAPQANITWTDLWHAPYSRALLRKYFRSPQGPIGYHNMAIGGDRLWDTRGGRAGVWTEKESIWMPWGEVDGVCGTIEQLKNVFGDGKGIWLHELEANAERERKSEEDELKKKIDEQKKKKEEEDKKKKQQEENKEKERQKAEAEKQNKEKEETDKKKADDEKKAADANKEKQKIQDEKKKSDEEEKKKKAQENFVPPRRRR